MRIDLEKHRDLQSQGIISIQQHPELPLLIHNYTQRCQWERLWNETTLICRGLITDLAGRVICRPFPKFFNLGEHAGTDSKLPPINWRQEFYVSEKMDGSLGIAYPAPEGYRIATRGSFVSEQAVRGTEMLRRFGENSFRDFHTYLFEIIYPENRIVIDYGNKECLVLLDIIDNYTGKGLPRNQLELEAHWLGCECVRSHVVDSEQLQSYSSDEANREGVVVRFEDGMRIKIKLEEYCRLHKLITGLNTKSIWEMLRDGKSLDEVLDRVPDEFFDWVAAVADGMGLAYVETEVDAKDILDAARASLGDSPRKEYAAYFKQYPELMGILFLMLDGQDYSKAIWKQLKPSQAMAFAAADDGE
jgi:hypothetical protein